MIPIVLRSPRLVLSMPTPDDVDAVFEYCRDPAFERFLTLPWPYLRSDAEHFLTQYVPHGWETNTEYTWALRPSVGGPLLGVIGFRVERADLGFWLGGLHRGQGYMTEAVGAVADILFELGVPDINWECMVGNTASLAVARKAGFTFTGERPALIADREGGHPPAWHGVLSADDNLEVKSGWPA